MLYDYEISEVIKLIFDVNKFQKDVEGDVVRTINYKIVPDLEFLTGKFGAWEPDISILIGILNYNSTDVYASYGLGVNRKKKNMFVSDSKLFLGALNDVVDLREDVYWKSKKVKLREITSYRWLQIPEPLRVFRWMKGLAFKMACLLVRFRAHYGKSGFEFHVPGLTGRSSALLGFLDTFEKENSSIMEVTFGNVMPLYSVLDSINLECFWELELDSLC